MLLPILSSAQATDWDRRAESGGIALATLMDAAGRAAAEVIATRFPDRLAGGVLVAAGPGNNGGDGWVLARALHRLEVPVFVAPTGGTLSPLNQAAAARAAGEGVRVVEADGPWPAVSLLVDALLGTGAHGALRPPVAAMVERLTDLSLPIVAIDGPTGVELDSGSGHTPAVAASLSITFGGLRRGHLLAREECGAVVVVDIGHPAPDPAWPGFFTPLDAATALPPFPVAAHKGDRGRIVVIGGEPGMSGALRLASRAAFAAGAGLVHAVGPAPSIAALIAAEPDLQTLAHPLEGEFSAAFAALLAQADVVVIGPGLGRGEGRRAFIGEVLRGATTAVLDADALNAFQGGLVELAGLAQGRRIVLTPHPGEFGRLFPELSATREMDPWAAATAAAAQSRCTVVLKGVPTVIATPEGRCLTVAAGNPGLATGGSGDILSGMLGTLLAQLGPAEVAAAIAAQALGGAADLAARRTTARGLRPMDVLAALPDLWRVWEATRRVRPVARPPILLALEAPQRW